MLRPERLGIHPEQETRNRCPLCATSPIAGFTGARDSRANYPRQPLLGNSTAQDSSSLFPYRGSCPCMFARCGPLGLNSCFIYLYIISFSDSSQSKFSLRFLAKLLLTFSGQWCRTNHSPESHFCPFTPSARLLALTWIISLEAAIYRPTPILASLQ